MVLLLQALFPAGLVQKCCARGSDPTAEMLQISAGFVPPSARSLRPARRTPAGSLDNRQISLIPCSRMRFQPGQSQSVM